MKKCQYCTQGWLFSLMSCLLQAAVRKQSREDRSILFSAAAWWKHGFKLCWNVPSLRPGCWILVSLMEIILCAIAMSWIQLFALQCLLCPALSPSSEGPSLPASPTLWQGRRQSHEHIFTPSLSNTHRMTVKPKHMLQLHLISFSYCLMAMSLPPSQVPSSRGIVILTVLFQHRQMLQQHRAISTHCSWIMQPGWKENN